MPRKHATNASSICGWRDMRLTRLRKRLESTKTQFRKFVGIWLTCRNPTKPIRSTQLTLRHRSTTSGSSKRRRTVHRTSATVSFARETTPAERPTKLTGLRHPWAILRYYLRRDAYLGRLSPAISITWAAFLPSINLLNR